jgi:hypothetical protein
MDLSYLLFYVHQHLHAKVQKWPTLSVRCYYLLLTGRQGLHFGSGDSRLNIKSQILVRFTLQEIIAGGRNIRLNALYAVWEK